MKRFSSSLPFIALSLQLLLFSGNVLLGQQQYLKATLDNNVSIQSESHILLGCITSNTILLEEIPIASDGYVHFTFSGLNTHDNITVSLQNENGSTYFQMQFVNDEAILSDHVGTNFLLSTSARNNSLFKIKKCGNSVIWSDAGDVPILTNTLATDEVLFAKVNVISATNAVLDLVFETSNEDCEKCAATGGQTLFPGDIMIAGYDNAASGNGIVLKNLVPIIGGTSFNLMQGIFNNSNNRWYSTTNDGNIAIQKITYTGTNSIPVGSSICFTLPTSGTGDALLANNFTTNGSANPDFCVENIGNTVNPKINLSAGNSSALCITQGNWKLLNAHGEFFGRVLSGLQYGGNWRSNAQTPQNGLSNIPPDIECMAIQDNLSPAVRYAYYTQANLTVADIANFGNWQVGSGALPSAACGSAPLLENADRSKQIMHSKDIVQLYPNPFKNSFTIQLQLAQAQAVQIDIYDSSGRAVYKHSYPEMDIGFHAIPILFPKEMSDLIFWTRVQLEDEIFIKRVVRQGTGIN